MENSKENKQKQGFWQKLFKLRGAMLALPVAAAAVILAVHNLARLPDQVGLNIQANGQYDLVLSKGVAVFGPLALTAICLVMVFCSKKVLYPWLISLFSLALPLLIYITNIFPG